MSLKNYTPKEIKDFNDEDIRNHALNTYKVLSMTNQLQQNIDLSFDNLTIFNESPDSYHFKLWDRVNSMFVEDLLQHQEFLLQDELKQ